MLPVVDRNDHRNSRMRIVVIAIVASIMSILVFKYVEGTFGNSEVAATAEQLSELRPRPVYLFISGFGCRDTIRESDASKRSQA